MAGAPKTSTALKRAIVLRDAGFSLAAIADKLNISPSTLYRHFKKHGVDKGSLSGKAIEEAKRQLLEDAGFVNDIKLQIAGAIVDDIAIFKQLRIAGAITLEQMMLDSSLAPHYRSRGIAALATNAIVTQKLIRTALGIDKLEPEPDTLPNLTITELTSADVEALRMAQDDLNMLTGVSIPEDEVIEEY